MNTHGEAPENSNDVEHSIATRHLPLALGDLAASATVTPNDGLQGDGPGSEPRKSAPGMDPGSVSGSNARNEANVGYLTADNLTELYLAHKAGLERAVTLILGNADESIVADAYTKALQNIREKHPTIPLSKASTWLHKIARNQALDELRHRHVLEVRSYSDPAEQRKLESIMARRDEWGKLELAVETNELLAVVLAKIGERNRKLLELSYRFGPDYDTIGQILGIKASSAKTAVSKAHCTARAIAREFNTP